MVLGGGGAGVELSRIMLTLNFIFSIQTLALLLLSQLRRLTASQTHRGEAAKININFAIKGT